jgi:hypothetical protein
LPRASGRELKIEERVLAAGEHMEGGTMVSDQERWDWLEEVEATTANAVRLFPMLRYAQYPTG